MFDSIKAYKLENNYPLKLGYVVLRDKCGNGNVGGDCENAVQGGQTEHHADQHCENLE